MSTITRGTSKKSLRRRARPRVADDFDVMTALAVYAPGPNGHGTRCLGFILPRGKSGFEGYDRDDRSIGLFPTQKAAADAITAKVAP